MAVDNKQISFRIYVVAFTVFVMALLVCAMLVKIQWFEGDHYRSIARQSTVKRFPLPATRGNVYSADGSLLATSVAEYTIRFDAVAPTAENFNENLAALADSLGAMLGKAPEYYLHQLQKGRNAGSRGVFIAKGLNYKDLVRIKSFPLFNLGANKGGIITEPVIVREHPMGKIAERTIGYDPTRDVGIEGAFGKYLQGKDGQRMMQKIAKGHWKPLSDNNEVEPVDGYDIVSTIDVYIQDIAHHALLKQLEYYEADHGCVVVMETKTGYVKAISNLGRGKDGQYYETINYAVGETQEPGSTFKLAAVMAMLEDKKVDTAKVYDCKGGKIFYYGHPVEDSNHKGWGKISLARGFEVSSNTVLVQAIYESYKEDPKKLLARLSDFGLDKKLGISIIGEPSPKIPHPGGEGWSGTSVPWMGFGYGISLTPLQMLAFYNAVANNGELLRPLFVQEIKEWDKSIKKFGKEVIKPKICSDETLKEVRAMMENVIKKGTGKGMYSPNFSMAGKTGTAKMDYASKNDSLISYSSSFAGYFPADNPQYSCIVVIQKPNKSKGYYGADVSGPVFSRIAQKIFTDVPTTNKVKNLDKPLKKQEDLYAGYYEKDKKKKTVPNSIGMSGMDAVAMLGEMGFKVQVTGNGGKVKKQSLKPGEAFTKNQQIILELK